MADFKRSNRSENTNTEPKRKKFCAYCATKTIPSYTDSVGLRRFVSTRGKIVSKLRSGVCSRHQRALTREVKHARHLALLPFMLKV
jgi:small subunit ribosomal protein S18